MSIGEVLAALRAEFPDVTVSKIRFLEARGLVEPARTPAGYRQFSPRDVDRLRYVLTAQRDHYLPLKVIKNQVDAFPAPPDGGVSGTDGRQAPPVATPAPPAPERPRPAPVRLTRPQMLTETGMTEPALAALDESGLLNRRRGGHYDADDVTIAKLVVALERFGLQPRHLRAFKGAADREIGLIEQAVGNRERARTESDRARLADETDHLAERLLQLHAALLHSGLRHRNPRP